jgi:4-amino-4-deoxy-L-arabinose transferase-like glycosyltransferase
MSVNNAVESPRLNIFKLDSRLASAIECFVSARGERVVVTCALACFFTLWTLFHTISNIAVSTDSDTSEVSVWAQHFAFGYKHPPLTAWIFSLWFSIFERSDFAVHLLAGVIVTSSLAVTWRLLRDHLDMNRALVGLAALTLVPLYTFLAPTMDANTVMMPFWPAALLFYLRARKLHGKRDAALAGAFAGLAFLGKYWAIYLIAGMAVASVVGIGTKKFWRSRAPYVMAASAAIVVAPHLYWYIAERGGDNYAFLTEAVLNADSFDRVLSRSGNYLVGSVAYVAGPLIFLAALHPGRRAFADIVWPHDADRQQALLLCAVPLLLPALSNLLFPQRLTPLWTIPNWPLLPVVLYGCPLITIDSLAAARAGLVALLVSLGAVAASPVRAYFKLQSQARTYEGHRAYYQQVAEAAQELAGQPIRILWGSWQVTRGLPFYLPKAHLLRSDPADARNRPEVSAKGMVIICSDGDTECLASGATHAHSRSVDIAVSRTFLGFASPPSRYRIIVVPASVTASRPFILDDVFRHVRHPP